MIVHTKGYRREGWTRLARSIYIFPFSLSLPELFSSADLLSIAAHCHFHAGLEGFNAQISRLVRFLSSSLEVFLREMYTSGISPSESFEILCRIFETERNTLDRLARTRVLTTTRYTFRGRALLTCHDILSIVRGIVVVEFNTVGLTLNGLFYNEGPSFSADVEPIYLDRWRRNRLG